MIQLAIFPLIAIIIAQLTKTILLAQKRKFSWRMLNSYGEMPSAHTAYVSGIAMQVFLIEGFSPAFAVALALSVITIRDAVGFRWHLQEHARALNMIVRDLHPKYRKTLPKIEEQLGHTIPQVVVGMLIGITTVILLNLIFNMI